MHVCVCVCGVCYDQDGTTPVMTMTDSKGKEVIIEVFCAYDGRGSESPDPTFEPFWQGPGECSTP